ncbi:hypothetical protein [Borreliella andersonii]|nr:hypothetical protein [Borreliella andersonii]WNY66255.1 hypothetical protein QIA45_04255 [Borreliella andersonii]
MTRIQGWPSLPGEKVTESTKRSKGYRNRAYNILTNTLINFY